MIDLRPNCTHQWKLNENNGGNIIEDYIGGVDGVLSSGTTGSAFTAEANPPNMNGSHKYPFYVNLDSLITLSYLGRWTISFWAKGNSAPSNVFGKGVCGNRIDNYNYVAMVNGSSFRYVGSHLQNFGWSFDTAFYGNWKHCVLQYTHGNAGVNALKLWIDAVVGPTLFTTLDLQGQFSLRQIGASTTLAATNFDGWIDNVIIWEAGGTFQPFLLTQAQIDFLYNSGIGTERLTSRITRPLVNGSLVNTGLVRKGVLV